MTTSLIEDLLLESVSFSHLGAGRRGSASLAQSEFNVPFHQFTTFTVGDIANTLRRGFAGSDCPDKIVYFDNSPLWLCLEIRRDGGTVLEMVFDDPLPYSAGECRTILESIFTKINIAISEVRSDTAEFWNVHALVSDPTVTIGQIVEHMQQAANSICLWQRSGGLDRFAEVIRKLRSGLFKELIGEAEAGWLEFKSTVDLTSELGRIELAQAVAGFANSERSGILAVGLRTSRVEGVDTVTKLSAVPATEHAPKRYLDILDQRVYPPVRGLTIDSVDAGNGLVVIVIVVSAQREDDKPFLTQGAVVNGKVRGGFFSIVRRRGEGSIPITAREVHHLLATGYRLTRQGLASGSLEE